MLMDFTFTRAMMKIKKTNPIKFKSNWSKESKEIFTKSKFISNRILACTPVSICGIPFGSDVQSR